MMNGLHFSGPATPQFSSLLRGCCAQGAASSQMQMTNMMMMLQMMQTMMQMMMQMAGGPLNRGMGHPAAFGNPGFGFGNPMGGMPFSGPSSLGGFLGGGFCNGNSAWSPNGTTGCTPGGSIPGGSNPTMTRLAQLADQEVRNNRGNGGQCYNRVANSLDKMGIRLSGGSAYMAADQLAQHPKVQEIKVSREQLTSLPAGAIVVWDKCGNRRHGHISVSLGEGREASDVYRKQLTEYGPRFRVFIPR